MSDWISVKERLPTKEERERSILWFHEYKEEWFPGEYFHYDGSYIRISMRHWMQFVVQATKKGSI